VQHLREENARLTEALHESIERKEELEQKLGSLEELMQKLESGKFSFLRRVESTTLHVA